MEDKYIQTIQNKILNLIPKGLHGNKGDIFRDSCSELSRLVASWIEKDNFTQGQTILKGDFVCNTKNSHDVLLSLWKNHYYLFDPTIWQFFPQDKTIFLGKYTDIDGAIKFLNSKYSGNWKVGEILEVPSEKEKRVWLKIIQKNIDFEINHLGLL